MIETIGQTLSGGAGYIIPFLVTLTILVFVHEMGHYLVARRNGVRVETFSIGFGPELFGWNDRAGTRWKISALPLGGYVKMFGDADPSGAAPSDAAHRMTPEERAVSFHHKRVGQRAAIVAAGPAANFIFAIVLLAGIFVFVGQPFVPAEVGVISENSAAARAGLRTGDRIVSIDGTAVERFEQVQAIVRANGGTPLQLVIDREGRTLDVAVTPDLTEHVDRLGKTHRGGLLGIQRARVDYMQYDPVSALARATAETWNLSVGTLGAVWEMIIGARPTDELGGPLRIAQMSGDVGQGGFVARLSFMAVLSINLGLINLFPIPILDGGHLLFYAAEAARRKPIGLRAQEYGFRIGLALVLTLMVFATWNDLVHLRIVEFFVGLVT